MNSWKENELSPRKKTPSSYGPVHIPRFQPLVPELSLFIPKSSSGPDNTREALTELNSKDSEKTALCSKPPQAPRLHGSSSTPSCLDEGQKEPLYDFLLKQNKMIAELQNEIKQLLQDRRSSTSLCRSCAEKDRLKRFQTFTNVSTQTSTDTLPLNEEAIIDPKNIEDVQSSLAPDIKGNLENSRTSLVLGASASMYEDDGPGDISTDPEPWECDEIINQIENASMERPQNSDEKLTNTRDAGENDVLGATLNRLKDIGVSFLRKDEFPGLEQRDNRIEYNSIITPRLNWNELSTAESISTASSQVRNSEALKGLDDQMLNRLIQRSRRDPTSHIVSTYGLSEHQFSMATRDFLISNGIIKQNPQQENDRY